MAGGVASLTQQQVQDMLERIGLGHLKPKFADNGVNGQDLLELTEDDYRESLGCTGLQMKKIKRELDQIQSKGTDCGSEPSSGGTPAPTGAATESMEMAKRENLEEKLQAAESAAHKYSSASNLLTSACKKLQGAAGSLQMTLMSGGMEMMQDVIRPGRGRGFRGRRGDMGHTMIEMATVKKAQGALKEAGEDIQKAMVLVPTIPFIKPATVKGAMSGVVLNALLMPGLAGDMMQQAKVKKAKAEIQEMAKECQMAQEWCAKSHLAATNEVAELRTTIKLTEMTV